MYTHTCRLAAIVYDCKNVRFYNKLRLQCVLLSWGEGHQSPFKKKKINKKKNVVELSERKDVIDAA